MAVSTWVGRILSVLLAVAFIGAGLAKLSPVLDANMHQQLQSKGPVWYKLWGEPFLGEGEDKAKLFLQAIGAAEVISGALLIVPVVGRLANLVLIVIMAGASATHFRLNVTSVHSTVPLIQSKEQSDIIKPAVLFTLLVVLFIIRNESKSSSKSTPAAGSKSPRKTRKAD